MKRIIEKDEKEKTKGRNKNGKTQLDPGFAFALSRIKKKQNGECTNMKKMQCWQKT